MAITSGPSFLLEKTMRATGTNRYYSGHLQQRSLSYRVEESGESASFSGRILSIAEMQCGYADLTRLASITVNAAMLTIRRTVELDVRMFTGALAPSKNGPTATLLPAPVLSRL